MTTALTPVAPSLYNLEQELAAYLDTESLITPEQEAEFSEALQRAIAASVEKRDRVGQFIRHCELQADNCDAEIERLRLRKKSFESAKQRIRLYVQHVIESLGTDEKGRTRKLEGETVTFSLRARPNAVEVFDDLQVPDEFKTITVTMTMTTWNALCDEVRADDDDDPLWHDIQRVTASATTAVSKAAIKAAIDKGLDVPGADVSIGGHSLVVR